jgi:hypothetical protein
MSSFQVPSNQSSATQPLTVANGEGHHSSSDKKSRRWAKYTDKKKWGKILSNTYLAAGFIFAALFVVQLGLTFGLGLELVVGVTTDYMTFNPVPPPGSFAPVLATPYTMPVDYIWMTAYFVASVASFLMYGMRKRIWSMMVSGRWASAIWIAMAVFYAFTTLAVMGTAGITNLMLLILVTVSAGAVCVFNGVALNHAAHPDHVKSSTGAWMMECNGFFMAFALSAVLVAIAWTYYGTSILTDLAWTASNKYILGTIIVYSFVLLVRLCLICMSLYWYKKSMSKKVSEDNQTQRIAATNVWSQFVFILNDFIGAVVIFVVRESLIRP